MITAPAVAAVTWPSTNGDWTAITQTTSTSTSPHGYVDLKNGSSGDSNTDIRGSNSLSAGYYYLDDTQKLLMFRIRINTTPYKSGTTWDKKVWQVLLETDGTASTIDWALQVDTNTSGSSDRVEFGSVTNDTKNDIWVKLSVSDTTWNSTTLFRTVATGETKFDSNPDYFIDMAIPYQVFANSTGIGIGDTFSIGLSTSQQHNNVNKDTPDGLKPNQGPFSDSITFDVAAIPEPSSVLLTGAGLVALFFLRRRQDRQKRLRLQTAAAHSPPPPSATA